MSECGSVYKKPRHPTKIIYFTPFMNINSKSNYSSKKKGGTGNATKDLLNETMSMNLDETYQM